MIGKINLSDRQDFSAGEPKRKAGPINSTEGIASNPTIQAKANDHIIPNHSGVFVMF